MKLKTAIIPLVFSVSAAAYADPYLGVSAGKTDYDYDEGDFDNPTAFELKLGSRFHKNFAVEISYLHFGDADYDGTPSWQISTDSITIAGVALLPVTDVLDLYVKVGAHKWDGQLREEGVVKVEDDSSTDKFYGVGINYRVEQSIELGASYSEYETDNADINLPAININYIFK